MIRVGINLLWLVPGVVGGTETMAVAVLRAVARRCPDDVEVVVVAGADVLAAHPDLADRFEVVRAPGGLHRRIRRVVVESTWLAALTGRAGLDVVHHFGNTIPPLRTAPAVVTVHDLLWQHHPDGIAPAKLAYLASIVPASVRAARLVVTPSAATAHGVVALGVPPQRVRVVPTPVTAPEPPAIPLDRPEGLDAPYVLYPAVVYPHKNHEVLLRAAGLLRADGQEPVTVVATGGPADDPATLAALDVVARAGGVEERWRRLGPVPPEELEALFAHAAAVVFPSRHEGFGLAAAEAIVRGVPVIAADTAALPEVVGDAGLLCDPCDPSAWAAAMAAVAAGGPERDALVAAAPQRAQVLTDESVVDALFEVWREAAGPP